MRGCSQGGACMVAPGGHAWLLRGVYMCGCSGGMCVAKGGMCGKRGHAWQRGACMVKGGMCGEGGNVW